MSGKLARAIGSRLHRTTTIRTRRAKALTAAAALAVQVGIVGVVTASTPANAAGSTTGTATSYTLEGCRNNGTITLPNSSGKFVCPDSAYTTGNLGKGWNELDLVPVRVTVAAGTSAPATQNFQFVLAVDNMDGGHPGYDVLSSDSGGTPVYNSARSSGTCGTLTASAQQYATPGVGGTDTSLYRTLTVTGQARNSTCVYDAFARLALGSHLYPGASLHFDLLNSTLTTSGIGAKDVSIPVKEIAPQELSKDMSATQGSDHVWNVVKSPSPASLSFTNTCDPSAPLSQGVAITVTWTKQAATPSGGITIVTHVYATNPAARVITIQGSDAIKSGTTVLETDSFGPIDVPANTTNVLLLTTTTSVPAGTTNLNDVATATYTDKVTGVAVPGSTSATASATVQQTGPELNGSAVINDVESITGAGLQFSVDSFSGATGSFDGGYVAGTPTVGPVSWTSSSQSGSGSVTFNKTVYATSASIVSGSLSDTATLTGSDGFTTTASLDVDISTNATVSLGVSKTTALQIASAQTFTFHLFDASTSPATDLSKTVTVTMPANSNGPVLSTLASGLSPDDTYYFHEDATAPYSAQDTTGATFSLVAGDRSSCTQRIDVTNNAAPARAKVQKITNPASSGLWTFTLTGPGGLSETLTNVQAGASYFTFASALDVDGGTYTITETPQSGYDLTSVTGDFAGVASRVSTNTTTKTCSFTLNLATDSAQFLECTFTNTLEGTIIVKKVTDPTSAADTFEFTGDASGTIGNGGTITVSHLVPGTYTSTEATKTDWDLKSITCDDGASTTPSSGSLATRTATFNLDAGETVTCTFSNTERGTIIVKKVTDPTTATDTFGFTGDASGTIGNGGTITVGNLVPGTYSSVEGAKSGWDLTQITCDDSASATASSGSVATRTATFKLDPGETVTCTFTNRERGHAKVVKTVAGQAPSGSQQFTFQLRSGASASSAGTTLETLTATAGNGGVLNFTTDLVPGQTYQMCEQMMPGWLTSLGPPLYSVYNPSGDNSVVCTDFTVAAGQTKEFDIDNNQPPGGMALTIGFWKNWASCANSNGKQKAVLDQTLLAAANAGTPITLGQLVLNPLTLGASTACKDAVNILNKTTIDGKTKKSSDPLFNMAAQLLAADLNIVAGAGSCAASTSAITQASALLNKYNFTGLGYSPKLTSSDASLANYLANQLDLYNNNKLC